VARGLLSDVKVLNQAVKRNIERFPEDFMFRLTPEEAGILKSQTVTSSSWGGRRRSHPSAFTEQGVAMLSSVLRSPQAVHVNIEIMRTFVKLRRLLHANEDLSPSERFASSCCRRPRTHARASASVRADTALSAKTA
jgi:hypothetical protein